MTLAVAAARVHVNVYELAERVVEALGLRCDLFVADTSVPPAPWFTYHLHVARGRDGQVRLDADWIEAIVQRHVDYYGSEEAWAEVERQSRIRVLQRRIAEIQANIVMESNRLIRPQFELDLLLPPLVQSPTVESEPEPVPRGRKILFERPRREPVR
jgi:hypothetical protein